MTKLVKYDAMCRAIRACVRIDDVKELRAQAQALAAYQRQAQNFDAERQCQQIRLRAERRCGELLKEMPVAAGGQPYQSRGASSRPDVPKTLAQLGISADQSSDWKKLAEIPEKDFEASLVAMDTPTTSGILRRCGTEAADIPSGEPRVTSETVKDIIWKLGWAVDAGCSAAQVAEVIHRDQDHRYEEGLAFAVEVSNHLQGLLEKEKLL